MKRNFIFLLTAIALLAILSLPMKMSGQTRTAEWIAADYATEHNYASSHPMDNETFNIDVSGAIQGKFSKDNGQNSPIYYNYNSPLPNIRMYAKNTFTITPASNTNITQIVYTFTIGNKVNNYAYASVVLPEGGTYTHGEAPSSNSDAVDETWTPAGESTNKAVVLKLGDSGQRGLVKVTVTYTISGADEVTLNYYPNGGTGLMEPEHYISGATTMVKPCAYERVGFLFEKWNTSLDGSGTNYYPGDYILMTSNRDLYAQWFDLSNGYVSVINTDNVNEAIAITGGSGWCDWTISESFADYRFTYNGTSYQNNNAIQINSTANIGSGIVTSVSTGLARRVVVTWNSSTNTGRTIDVYGSNVPYTSPANLFGATSGTHLGSIVKGTGNNTVFEISGDYAFIGIRSNNGAIYMNEVSIEWSLDAQSAAIHFTPESINLGNIQIEEECSATFYVSQRNLGSSITLEASQGNLLPNPIPLESDPTEVTWTYTPTTAGPMTTTVTATSTWEPDSGEPVTITATLNISALVFDPAAGTSLWEAKKAFLEGVSANAAISLVNVQVIGKYGNYLFLQDEDAGLLVYGSGAPDLQKGDKFTSGTLTGTFTMYQNNIVELTEFEFLDYGVENNQSLTVTVASISDLLADDTHTYEHRYVELDDVNFTITNTAWSIGDGGVLPLNDRFNTAYFTKYPPETDDPFTVKGLYNPYSSNNVLHKEIVPTELGDISTTVRAGAPTANPESGTEINPRLTTSVTITPADYTTIDYNVNRDDRIQSDLPVTINIEGPTSINVFATRDFYDESESQTWYYTLPNNVKTVHFSVNGVSYGPVYVVTGGHLQANQCPAVENIDDYCFRGWSTSPSSTTVISLSQYAVTESVILYAVYTVPSNYAYTKLDGPSDITAGEYVIVGDDGIGNYYTIKNAQASSSPEAYLLSNLGLSISGNNLVGDDLSEVTWTFAGTPNEMTVTSTADSDLHLYTTSNASGVRVGNPSGEPKWTVCEDNYINGYFNLKYNPTSRYLTLYKVLPTVEWRCYVVNEMYTSPRYPRLTLFKKVPVFATSDPSYTRVFNNEEAVEAIDINGPSIIPSGKYLSMGTLPLTNEGDAADFIIEDGATFTPAVGFTQTINATVKKAVAGYGTDMELNNGWYLLASPVGSVSTLVQTTSDGHVSGLYEPNDTNYDLYTFDQDPADGMEWRNNKANGGTSYGHWEGILYASQVDRMITYEGTLVTNCNNQALAFSGNGDFKGWNLIGNPFTCPAYLSLDNYYKLETVPQGDEMVSELQLKSNSEPVAAMEGIFVQATTEGQTFSFTTNASQGSNGDGLLNVKVVSERGLVADQAMVRFGEGTMLGKFQLNENGTKLYIPQGGKDYAVVRVDNCGETPINFHVAKSGLYTISVEPENVEMTYLHLIDNMTGADIDLLPSDPTLIAGEDPQSLVPQYTFTAKTSDYPSRFRLVFSAQTSEPVEGLDQPFAFISNGDIVVNGIGTLQVIDMMGHVIVCRDAIHRVSTSDMAPGIYVLRLINGEEVKTQKMVVR